MHWTWWDVQALPVEVYDVLLDMLIEESKRTES